MDGADGGRAKSSRSQRQAMKMLTAGKDRRLLLLDFSRDYYKRDGIKMPTISVEDLAEYVDFLHDKSMDTAEIAFSMKSKDSEIDKDDGEYLKRLFQRSYEAEIRAADHANQIREQLEPTTSILYRSAAHLAHNAGMKEKAKAAAEMCLAGKFAAEFKEELMPYVERGDSNE